MPADPVTRPVFRVFHSGASNFAAAPGLEPGWYYQHERPVGPFETKLAAGAAARAEIVALAEPHWTDRFTGMQMTGEGASDAEVATSVRMLQRYHPDHEQICVTARDRIAKLSRENRDLRARPDRLVLGARELAAVLAGLRLFQLQGDDAPMAELSDQGIDVIATDTGQFEALTAAEIDALCERLNGPKEPGR